jgi:signal transduction histidine kinase
LHDVLSHSLAAISLQAGAALHVLDADPAQARQLLAGIRVTSTEALAQARAALATIRGEHAPAADASASVAPGLEALPALVASVHSTGLVVRLNLDEPGPLPAAVGATAYRLVQESLTNVLCHAGPGASAQVNVGRAGRVLRVEVCDDGRGPAADASRVPGGHGLVGMRERVAELGGRLDAGPAHGGGFRVAADLPLDGGAR